MARHPDPVPPQPGRESVWRYPRPPRLESTTRRLRVTVAGRTIADTRRGLRVLETSHPPVYYFPPDDVVMECLIPADQSSFCEWKGLAEYRHVEVGAQRIEHAAWVYRRPTAAFRALRSHIAFYAAPGVACYVDDELARPQPGGFYGGWITADIVGPFKGQPGTQGW